MMNYTETIVRDVYRDILVHFPQHCHCSICEEDVLCMALNELPPNYITTVMGETYAKLAEMRYSHKAQAVQAVSRALEIVHKNPRH